MFFVFSFFHFLGPIDHLSKSHGVLGPCWLDLPGPKLLNNEINWKNLTPVPGFIPRTFHRAASTLDRSTTAVPYKLNVCLFLVSDIAWISFVLAAKNIHPKTQEQQNLSIYDRAKNLRKVFWVQKSFFTFLAVFFIFRVFWFDFLAVLLFAPSQVISQSWANGN